MRPTYDEFVRWRDAQGVHKTVEREYQRQAVVAVGKKAETVVAHEGWQTFLDHLATLRATAQKSLDALISQAALGDVWGDALVELKARIRAGTAEVRTLDLVTGLIPSLIDAGRAAETPTPQPESYSA